MASDSLYGSQPVTPPQRLDDEEVLQQADKCILDPCLRNMVIEYGIGYDNFHRDFWFRSNLTAGEATDLCHDWSNRTHYRQSRNTRWIAIFDAHEQREFVSTILKQYDVPTELKESMLSAPGTGNIELARKVWDWYHVKNGAKFRAVGFNILYDLGLLGIVKDTPHENEVTRNKNYIRRNQGASRSSGSSGHDSSPRYDHQDENSSIYYDRRILRLWLWIILTKDGTVITIHEPLPPNFKGCGPQEQLILGHVRKNLRAILWCLSDVRTLQGVRTTIQNACTHVPTDTNAAISRQKNDLTDALLFYYLFGDWQMLWSIVLERNHPYSRDLDRIRKRKPQLENIDQLEDISYYLASLKRVYRSYELMLETLMPGGNDTYATGYALRIDYFAAPLFNLLKYRIRHLAIAEIEGCETEVQGLISLTRDRLNFRNAQEMERLGALLVTLVKVVIVTLLLLLLITLYLSVDVEGISGKATEGDL